MKIYTQTFDVANQSPKRFWVAPYSDFKIGVKIVKNGTPIANEFTVKKNGVALEADEYKVDGFTTFTLQSAGTGNVEYAIEVSGVGEKMKLVQIITDSTVFEVGGEGGSVPPGVATQDWVQEYVTEETSSFTTQDDVSQAISTATNDMATQTWVGSQTSGLVTGLGYSEAPKVSNVMAVYATDWGTISANADANTFYVVLPDPPAPVTGQSTFILTNNTTDTRLIEGSLNYDAISDIADQIKVANIGNAVSAIADYTWGGAYYMTDITLPGSVTSIGESSFEGCNELSSVTMAEGLQTIGATAFSTTGKLKEFVIPASVTTIGRNAFVGSRTSVTFMGKTLAQVQAMTNYPWGITDTSVIHAELS